MSNCGFDEDEISILQEQEKFLKSKAKPSANVVSLKATPTAPKESLPEELPTSEKPINQKSKVNITPVITEIVERDIVVLDEVKFNRDTPFPKIQHRSERRKPLGLREDTTNSGKHKKNIENVHKNQPQKVQSERMRQKVQEIGKRTAKIQNFVLPNFDKFEKEKLKWTSIGGSEVGESESTNSSKKRFDFEGNPISEKDLNSDYQSKLYHHGEDPDQPGYTLSELLTLSQSSVPSQRTISYNILSRIISNSFNKLDLIVIHQLIEMNIVMHLRNGIDDPHNTPMVAALVCLHSFLCSDFDNLFDHLRTNTWNQIKEFYLSFSNIENEDPNDKDEAEDDATITKRDPIYGIVICMGLISRLRYFLCQPSNVIPLNIKILSLDIIERCCYHSPFITTYIFETPHLLEHFEECFADEDCIKDKKKRMYLTRVLQVIQKFCLNSKFIAEKLLSLPKFSFFLSQFHTQNIDQLVIQRLNVEQTSDFDTNSLVLFEVSIHIITIYRRYAIPLKFPSNFRLKITTRESYVLFLVSLLENLLQTDNIDENNDVHHVDNDNVCTKRVENIVIMILLSVLSSSNQSLYSQSTLDRLFSSLTQLFQRDPLNITSKASKEQTSNTSIHQFYYFSNLCSLSHLLVKNYQFQIGHTLSQYLNSSFSKLVEMFENFKQRYSYINSHNYSNYYIAPKDLSHLPMFHFHFPNIEDFELFRSQAAIVHCFTQILHLFTIDQTSPHQSTHHHHNKLENGEGDVNSDNNSHSHSQSHLSHPSHDLISKLFKLLTFENENYDKYPKHVLYQYHLFIHLQLQLFRCFISLPSSSSSSSPSSSQLKDETQQFHTSLYFIPLMMIGDELALISLLDDFIFSRSHLHSVIKSLHHCDDNTAQQFTSEIIKLKRGFIEFFTNHFNDTSKVMDSYFLSKLEHLPVGKQWLFLPVDSLFDDKKIKSSDDLQEIKSLLFSALLFVSTFLRPNLSCFERTMIIGGLLRIFILPNEIYREVEISSLMQRIAKHVLPTSPQQTLNFFLLHIMGIENILNDLIAEYSASSYGDAFFSQLILLFLRMDQPSTYRKMVWRGLAHYLHFLQPNFEFYEFNDNNDDGDDKKKDDDSHDSRFFESFVCKVEDDRELLHIYETYLSSSSQVMVNPFLYKVVQHHLQLLPLK